MTGPLVESENGGVFKMVVVVVEANEFKWYLAHSHWKYACNELTNYFFCIFFKHLITRTFFCLEYKWQFATHGEKNVSPVSSKQTGVYGIPLQ